MKKIFITGCAGFIGFHTALKFLSKGFIVIGIDNLNNYYDLNLKKHRLKILKNHNKFIFHKVDLIESNKIENICKKNNIEIIIHLAAQAGVRYSFEEPKKYFESNLIGFFNILEISRKIKLKHLIIASSSSVYGNQKKFPVKESFNTDFQISFYAASKKSNEILAHSYSRNYKIPITCLRFFTAYGPYGRPDMAIFSFTKSILESKTINLYNKGNNVRDFTYIDDVVESIFQITKFPSKRYIPFDVFNISASSPTKVLRIIELIELKLNKKAKLKFTKKQLGDVVKTHASTIKIGNYFKLKKKTNIENGIAKFIDWYNSYYIK